MVEGSSVVTAAADIDDVLALSPLQLGLYSHATLIGPDGDDPPYVIAMTADVTGPLDVALLRGCAAAMLVRHPNLRASFWHQDLPRPVQIIPAMVELPWQHVAAIDDEQAARLEKKRERGRAFTLHDGPLIRFLLIELPDQRWRLVVTAHHIVIDGWSLPVFIGGEMLTLYRIGGDLEALPPSTAVPRLHRLAGRARFGSGRTTLAPSPGRDARADDAVTRPGW